MRKNILINTLCLLLTVSIFAVGCLPCYAKNYTVGETDSLIGGIVSKKASTLGVRNEQGIVDYFSSASITSGGEWYILSFIQNGNGCNNSAYEKALINYLKNNTVYQATTREKFALMLIAMNTRDSWAKQYVAETTNEAIGKQGIMSYVFGLHLLNNGCQSNIYTKNALVSKIISLQNSDGGWAVSGSNSDVDVTAMTLQALAMNYSYARGSINSALSLLSSRQSENGDFQSYGTYNAESTAQVVIALSALGINPASDNRFVKNGNSVIDGLLSYRQSDGGFAHVSGGAYNNSATSQALNAFVAYSRYLKGRGSFYSLPYSFVPPVTVTSTQGRTTNASSGWNTTSPSIQTTTPTVTSGAFQAGSTEGFVTASPSYSQAGETTTLNEVASSDVSSISGDLSETEALGNTQSDVSQNETDAEEQHKVTLTKDTSIFSQAKYKILVIGIILALAIIVSLIFVLLKKRNYKNFLVIFGVGLVLVAIVLFTDIVPAKKYYNGAVGGKENIVGTVTLTVRCDTVVGKENAPENPVIIEKTEFEISEGDTAYTVLAEASRKTGVPFEHNSSYYVSGIDNLYEFQFGELSGWMYKVNGILPSVGCNEYILSDGDEIEWLYTCDIGNDLK